MKEVHALEEIKNFKQSWKVTGEAIFKLEERYATSHVNMPNRRPYKSMNGGEIAYKKVEDLQVMMSLEKARKFTNRDEI